MRYQTLKVRLREISPSIFLSQFHHAIHVTYMKTPKSEKVSDVIYRFNFWWGFFLLFLF